MIYIFINQATRYLFIDIINCFAEKRQNVVLYTGEIREGKTKINKNIKTKLLIKYNNSTAFKRLFTWLIFTFIVFFKILFMKKRNTTLILVSTPPFLTFLGIFFNKFFGVPYYLIIYDIYPDVLVSFKVLKQKSFLIKSWNKLNVILYKRATKVFTISSFMSNRIKEQGCNEKKIYTVSNWVDTSFIQPIKKYDNYFLKELGLENKFIIIYSGNMGATHDIETLIIVAESLKNISDIHFLIIGDGIKKKKIEQIIEDKALRNITSLPLLPSEVLPYSLASGDLAYVTLDIGAENSSVPSKLFYMLAAGCGIISVSSKKSELGFLTKHYNFGRIFAPGEINEIKNFILECKSNKEKLSEYKNNARIASFDFSPKNALQFYKQIIDV